MDDNEKAEAHIKQREEKAKYAQAMNELGSMYKFIERHCDVLFSNRDNAYSIEQTMTSGVYYIINRDYRAVYMLRDADDVDDDAIIEVLDAEQFTREFGRRLERVKKAFDGVFDVEASDQGYGRLPFPHLLGAEMGQVYRIDLHANHAHKSIARRVDADDTRNYCVVAKIMKCKASDDGTQITFIDDSDKSKAEAEINAQMCARLDELNIRYRYEQFSIDSVEMCIHVADLVRLGQCDYVQVRTHSGKQYRYKAYYHDQHGYDRAGDLMSVGVMVITDRNVQFSIAGGSKTRNDALYVANHPDEIQLDLPRQIPRFYRKYVKK